MGLGRLLQRIALVDFYLDLAGEHDVEQILCHRRQIGALRGRPEITETRAA